MSERLNIELPKTFITCNFIKLIFEKNKDLEVLQVLSDDTIQAMYKECFGKAPELPIETVISETRKFSEFYMREEGYGEIRHKDISVLYDYLKDSVFVDCIYEDKLMFNELELLWYVSREHQYINYMREVLLKLYDIYGGLNADELDTYPILYIKITGMLPANGMPMRI